MRRLQSLWAGFACATRGVYRPAPGTRLRRSAAGWVRARCTAAATRLQAAQRGRRGRVAAAVRAILLAGWLA
eukprot:COSAG01_NODE_2602_length_7394_cov_2.281563_1_plen_71_part_10